MIACVTLSAYKKSCIDLTDSETSSAHLPAALQGAVSLTVGRNTKLPEKLYTEPYTWMAKIKAENQLTATGSLLENLERTYDTHWAAALRHGLTVKSHAERDRWLIDDYQSVMSDKAKPNLELQGIDHPQSAVLITSNTEFRNVFNPELLSNFYDFDQWLSNLTNTSKSKNIRYPYRFAGIKYQSQFNYKLQPGKTLQNVGPKLDYLSAWGSFHRYYHKEPNSVTAFTELTMPQAYIPIDKIAEFNRFLDISSREARIWFSLNESSEASTNGR